MKRTWSALLAIGLVAGVARAGGSMGSGRVIALLKKSPTLWSCLGRALDFAPGAWAARCGSHWPGMGGARIAPYYLWAKLKGEKNYTLEVKVDCEQHFFDKRGKELKTKDGEVTDEIIKKAVRVEEKMISVTLTPRRDEKGRAKTPAHSDHASQNAGRGAMRPSSSRSARTGT